MNIVNSIYSFRYLINDLSIAIKVLGEEKMLGYPVSAFVELTSKCNLRCKHCYNNSGISISEIDINILKKLIKDLDSKIVTSITISGGEPLLYAEISELLSFIARETSLKVAVNSNGILLNDEEYIGMLLENNVSDIQISLDGMEMTHDLIRGPGSYCKTIEAIKKCIKKGIRVRIGYTVNAVNYNELEDVCAMVRDLGAVSMAVYRYIPTSTRDNHESLDFDKATLLEASKKVIEIQKKYVRSGFNIYFEKLSFFAFLLDKNYISMTKCLAGQAQLNIDSSLNVSMCAHLHNISGNIKESSIEDIWKKQNSLLEKLKEIPEDCIDCEYANICKGGCKGISFCLNNNYNTKDTCCFKELL